jgi:UDP-N-acetylmuramoylalanine--D-glutamate ligase
MKHLVLGAGMSGRAAAQLLRRNGHEAVLFDDRPEALATMRDEAFETHGGEWHDGLLKGVALVVTSPGFPDHAPPISAALRAGIDVWSELELGYRHTTAAVIAVTGTNGKTTTTQLIAEMLVASGIDAVAAGNIGMAISDVAESGHRFIVAEASSFQLRFISTFSPRVAVVTNVAPDHLDWHGSYEAYVAAKARITENMAPTDPLVYDEDDPGAAALAVAARTRGLAVSGRRHAAAGGLERGMLAFGANSVDVGPTDPILGINLAIAAVAAAEAGATADGIAAAAASFRPGAHRRTVVAELGGVTWVDDSKATNPHAAVASASSYPSVVLIAGGRNKGLDLSSLTSVPTVHHIVAIGESASELVVAAGERAVAAATMVEAVEAAAAVAEAGDTVLLAPGCASFDQYESYAERGDVFADAVRARSD